MSREIALRKKFLPASSLETIYLGGGTPSLLSFDELSRLFQEIGKHFTLHPKAEITLEANPDDIDEQALDLWKEVGINRLSIGIQTFNNKLLKKLNRIHSSEEAIKAVELAREKGFNNINTDLIYALPDGDFQNWVNDVDKMIALAPTHISAYHLTIEPDTVFGRWYKTGRLNPIPEDNAIDQYEYLCSRLSAAGFDHYEVSNFGKKNYYSRHNTNYWNGTAYLGIGPGAHSFVTGRRQVNVANNPRYIKALKQDELPFEEELLTKEQMIDEYLITHLRTSHGIDLHYLKSQFNFEFTEHKTRYLALLQDQGKGSLNDGRFVLNEEGFLIADHVALELSLTV